MDKFTPEQRSKIMSAIRSRDTLPEVIVILECALKTVAERERPFTKVSKWLKEVAR